MSGHGLFDEHRYSTKGWQVRAQNSMDQASFLSHQKQLYVGYFSPADML